MVNRGLRVPTSVTADGAPGLINAIEAVWRKSLRIRCCFAPAGQLRAKLPDHAATEVMAHVRAIRDAATLDAARAAADRAINTFSGARHRPPTQQTNVEEHQEEDRGMS